MPGRWVMFLLSTALMPVLSGCSDKPPELAQAKPVHPSVPDAEYDLKPSPAPASSDAEAVEFVRTALNVHTNNRLDSLAAFRTSTVTYVGNVRAGGPALNPQTWTFQSAWPDKFRVRVDLPGSQYVTFARNGLTGWKHGSITGGNKLPLPTVEFDDLKPEGTATWLLLLFPFIEPETILAPATDSIIAGKSARGIRIWHPSLNDAVAHFDKESRLLVRITYSGREGGLSVNKEVTVLEQGEYQGVTLAKRTVVKARGNELADWQITTVEAKPSFPEKHFEEP